MCSPCVPRSTRAFRLFPAVAALLLAAPAAKALTLVSGPVLALTTNAPLAAELQLETDLPSRVIVQMTDGQQSWSRFFWELSKTHSLPLLGFKPDRTNEITVSVLNERGEGFTLPGPLSFVTDPLPADFPTIVVFTNVPEKMEPGYTLFRVQNRNDNAAYITILDNLGEVVWYSGIPTTSDVRQLANGNLFIPLTTNFVEANLLGETVQSWPVPDNLSIDLHDGVPTDHDSILYINDTTEVLSNFPTSDLYPNSPLRTTSVIYNRVVEISAANSSLLNLWTPIDWLDPYRLTYLTFDLPTPQGLDIEHGNAVLEDPRDHSILFSMREQNAIIKFTRDGQLKWILGPHEGWGPQFQQYLLTPVGTNFAWQFGQHAPRYTPYGTLMVYDDGNYRASPFEPQVPNQSNYSRAVEYDIDEQNMQIRQVWDYGRTNEVDRLYTDRVGNADYLPERNNVLVTFGYVIYVNGLRPAPYAPNATMARIQEVTHTAVPTRVFDVAFFDYNNTNLRYLGYFIYRAHRIPELYPPGSEPAPAFLEPRQFRDDRSSKPEPYR